jgi:hypothetical protein
MGKSIRTMEASTDAANAPAHLSDEFPAGYSLKRCSPAELVSASPAGVNDAVAQDQLREFLNNDRSRTEKRNQFHRQQSTLTGQFFCPKNGETLTGRGRSSFMITFGGPNFRTRAAFIHPSLSICTLTRTFRPRAEPCPPKRAEQLISE